MATSTAVSCDVLELVRATGDSRVRLAAADIDGVLRGKYMHPNKFFSAADDGFGFCSVVFGWDSHDACYDDVDYTGWHTGYPDALAKIDLSTFRRVPWDEDVPFFLVDFVDDVGAPLEVCPRQVLKSVVRRGEKLGFEALFGLEFEFFNFQETPKTLAQKSYRGLDALTPGMFGYSILRSSLHKEYMRALMEDLAAFDVPVEGLHTETGPGVYEAALACSDPVEAADRGVLFKTSVKEIAYRFGIIPTFMAKWDEKLPGSSGHLHQSLLDGSGKNVFYDPKGRASMSGVFESYLAGQLKALTELLPLFAPTVNSYKRLVKGLWAPTHVTWGVDNRTPALRVIPGTAKSTRLETRVCGADINPYLAVAAALGSGLYGIEKGFALKEAPVQGNAYEAREAQSLPKTLLEATIVFERSEMAREIFGDAFVDHYAATRRWEWAQYQKAVTTWELERYFEII